MESMVPTPKENRFICIYQKTVDETGMQSGHPNPEWSGISI